MEQFMIIKLVSITLVFIVLTSEVSTSPARSRAPDRSGKASFKKINVPKNILLKSIFKTLLTIEIDQTLVIDKKKVMQ